MPWGLIHDPAFIARQNRQFAGTMQGFGGVAEAVAGGALTLSGVGSGIGVAILFHGLDNSASGLYQAETGKTRQTLTSRILIGQGVSPDLAEGTERILELYSAVLTRSPGKRGAAPKARSGLLNEGTRTTELADAGLLKKLDQRGFSIDQSAEIQRYLDSRKANAATFLEKDLLLRPDARKVEVLEEYLHNVQKDIGLMDKMTPAQMEVHVKEFMLRHQKMLGISAADAQWLKNWLDTAKRAQGK